VRAVFANPARKFQAIALQGMLHEHHRSANLFSRCSTSSTIPPGSRSRCLDGTRISYADLIARAGQMANVLVSRGVKPGDRVARKPRNPCRRWCSISAPCARCGVSAAQHRLYAERSEYFIGDAEPSLVVCDPSKRDGIGAIAAKVKAGVETLGPTARDR
jgi:malonyl-CoA/methylmalonyl-CoA synthetase